MLKCWNGRHKWQATAVFVGKQCVMLRRCKRKFCKEFMRSSYLTLIPEPGSINASLDEVPTDFREHLIKFVGSLRS